MTHFSPREQEILNLLAQHYTYAEMAATLGIRISTVDSHIRSIVQKTDVHRHIKLAGFAIAQGYGKEGDSN